MIRWILSTLEPDYVERQSAGAVAAMAQLTLEEFVRAQEEMAELSERFADMRRQGRKPDLEP